MDPKSHSLCVIKKSECLHRMMQELAGEALISLEGDLGTCSFPHELIISNDPLGAAARSTLHPELDFVVLRLTHETLDPIFKQIMTAGLKRAIIHIQIVREGVLQFGAYDNFHPNCVVAGPAISSAYLDQLKAIGIIRSFDPVPQVAV